MVVNPQCVLQIDVLIAHEQSKDSRQGMKRKREQRIGVRSCPVAGSFRGNKQRNGCLFLADSATMIVYGMTARIVKDHSVESDVIVASD